MSENYLAHPSDEFTQQVKQILENLHDFGYIQKHSLSLTLESTRSDPKEAGWEYVRRELLLAIEALSPEANPPISSPRARSYNVINLHYLEEIPLHQCAQEMGISLRQINRELRRAEQSLAAILWSKFGEQLKNFNESTLYSQRGELEQIRLNFELFDMELLFKEASQEVAPLALEHGVQFKFITPEEKIIILSDKMTARQVVITILSRLIQSSQPGNLQASFFQENETRGLEVHFNPSIELNKLMLVEPFMENLLSRMEWRYEIQNGLPAVCKVIFESNPPPTLLVIDDNEGMSVLLERYLSGRRCRLVTAHSGMEGQQLAGSINPDAVMLDVMMPGMDGWQVLNRLKSNEATHEIPVIVCSVFNDPRLARSLGAAVFLPKPLKREDFLNTLQEMGM